MTFQHQYSLWGSAATSKIEEILDWCETNGVEDNFIIIEQESRIIAGGTYPRTVRPTTTVHQRTTHYLIRLHEAEAVVFELRFF